MSLVRALQRLSIVTPSVRQIAVRTSAALAGLCCFFTLASPARADESQRWGTTVRAGTAVGFTHIHEQRLTALGTQIAVGHKVGPFAIEAEYESLTLLEYQENEYHNEERGDLHRLGVNGRFYFARIGPREPGSVVLLWAEGGIGRQFGQRAGYERIQRHDLSIGTGFILDHRFKRRPKGLPFNYVGWHFGWRLSATPRPKQGAALLITCKSQTSCPRPELEPGHDIGLIVSSSMSFAW